MSKKRIKITLVEKILVSIPVFLGFLYSLLNGLNGAGIDFPKKKDYIGRFFLSLVGLFILSGFLWITISIIQVNLGL